MTMIDFPVHRHDAAPSGEGVINLPSRFDAHRAHCLAEALGEAEVVPGPVVVDGSAVRFIDVYGLQALVDARLACLEAGRDLEIDSASPALRVTLELTGYGHLLRAEAVELAA